MSNATSPDQDRGVSGTVGAAQESGQQVASAAADHAHDLAGSAAEKASDVAADAKEHASDLLSTTRDQVGEEAERRRNQAVSSLRTVGDELDSMRHHDGEKGIATELAARGGGLARQAAEWLDGRDASQILDDTRRFARERPGTFLLGALVAGVVAGRLTRSLKAGAPSSSPGREPSHAAPAAPAEVAATSTPSRPDLSGTAAVPPVPGERLGSVPPVPTTGDLR